MAEWHTRTPPREFEGSLARLLFARQVKAELSGVYGGADTQDEGTSSDTKVDCASRSNDGIHGDGGCGGTSFYDAAQREWAAAADPPSQQPSGKARTPSQPPSGKARRTETDNEDDDGALRQIVRNVMWLYGDCSSPREPSVTVLLEHLQSWTRELVGKVRARSTAPSTATATTTPLQHTRHTHPRHRVLTAADLAAGGAPLR